MKSILLVGIACCIFFAHGHAQQLGWVHTIGGSAGGEGAAAIAVSAQGNLYSTGCFGSTVDFDPGPGTHLLSTTSLQSYISKTSPTGGFVWAGELGSSPGNANSHEVFIDAQENVYVTGSYTGTCDFDPGLGTYYLTSSGTFVVKLDSSGNFLWAKSLTASSGWSIGYGITVDDAGNVYVSGGVYGTTDFDPGPGNYFLTSASPTSTDVFITKLDPLGNFEWAKQFGGTGADLGLAITVDLAGNCFVTGTTQGGMPFQTNGQYNAFALKLDSIGNTRWIEGLEGGSSYLCDIALDAQANVYLAGHFADTCDMDPGAGTHFLIDSVGGTGIILKLDSSGNFQRVSQWVTDSGCVVNAIAVDPLGNSVIAGGFRGTGDFDPGLGVFNLTVVQDLDGFYAKVDTAGNLISGGAFSGRMYEEVADVGMDQYGNVFCGGGIEDTVDLDPGPGILNFNSQGFSDLFHLKLDFCTPPPSPIVTTFSPSICAGDSITLTANGIGILRWWDALNGGTQLATGNSFTTPALTATTTFYVQDSTCAVSPRTAVTVAVTPITYATLSASACGSFTSPSGNHVWTTSGTYMDTLPNMAGCDSVVTMILTVITVDTSVTNASPILTANAPAATYQWMYCDSAIIPGQTNASFTPTTSGSYAVAITQAGCTDTSSCYPVTVVAITAGSAGVHLKAYPNPTDGRIKLEWTTPTIPVALYLRNAMGQEVVYALQSAPFILDIPGSKGIYQLELLCADGQRFTLKVAKQ